MSAPLPPPITSVRYPRGTDPLPMILAIVDMARSGGLRIAGALQKDTPVAGRLRCRMDLEDLATGRLFPISEDRGAAARGRNLDLGLLAEAEMALLAGLRRDGADLVVVNKFGKSEAMGGGLRGLVVAGLEADIPVLVGVPLVNLEAWQRFVAGVPETVHWVGEGRTAAGASVTGKCWAVETSADRH